MVTRVAVVISILCLVLPAAAPAQRFAQGDKEVLLSGSGASDQDFDSTIFAINGSLGYFFTDKIEGAVRQSVHYSQIEDGGSAWNGSTLLAVDYHFDMGRVWPFIGANIGWIYGDGVTDTGLAGPEGGVKIFVTDAAFILGMVQFDWFFDSDDESFDDGQWTYLIGVGFRWQ